MKGIRGGDSDEGDKGKRKGEEAMIRLVKHESHCYNFFILSSSKD